MITRSLYYFFRLCTFYDDDEISGMLKINKGKYRLEKFFRGNNRHAPSLDNQHTFHTHPIHSQRTCFGWPSLNDYMVFLHMNEMITHMIPSMEGIWMIEKKINTSDLLDLEIAKKTLDDANIKKLSTGKCDAMNENRYYMYKNQYDNYIEKINNIKFSNSPIFEIRLITWKQLRESLQV